MSYEWLMGYPGTYTGVQSLGLYNSITPMGYWGSSYGLPFSSVFSNVLGSLTANGLSTENIAGFRTISADSALQSELNKLGYGKMMILIPEEYQKQVEENTQKVGDTFKKWKTNYDTANLGKSQVQSSMGSQRKGLSGASHTCSLYKCTICKRT
ncbi:MAG: hypothetical protein J1E65_08650 [Lachnospiraceae bacterium]|nr:hypothetical protein [Lachnospiraceae bacterium]